MSEAPPDEPVELGVDADQVGVSGLELEFDAIARRNVATPIAAGVTTEILLEFPAVDDVVGIALLPSPSGPIPATSTWGPT